jgi:hypothetical protein
VSANPRALGFVRQNGERRFQPVRQVSGFRNRATHGVLPLIEQRVEIVDERLHFARVGTFDAAIAPFVQSCEPRSKVLDG